MEIKTRLLELVEGAFAEERALMARLPEAERAAQGEPDHWAPKDVIAHLADWKERLIGNLTAAARGEAPVRYADRDEWNTRGFLEHRERPWQEIMERAVAVHGRFGGYVADRSESELRSTGALPWQAEQPLWRMLLGAGYLHAITMHLSPIYIERGEEAYATEMQERVVEQLGELDAGVDWQSTLRYNLACHYALIGEKERALAGLRQALELNPELSEWSRQDPDLACLREEPGYLDLYT